MLAWGMLAPTAVAVPIAHGVASVVIPHTAYVTCGAGITWARGYSA